MVIEAVMNLPSLWPANMSYCDSEVSKIMHLALTKSYSAQDPNDPWIKQWRQDYVALYYEMRHLATRSTQRKTLKENKEWLKNQCFLQAQAELDKNAKVASLWAEAGVWHGDPDSEQQALCDKISAWLVLSGEV